MPRTVTSLHWICTSPSPYNDFLFRYLHAHLSCRLLVHFLHTAGTEHASLVAGDTGYDWRKIESIWGDGYLMSEASKPGSFFLIGGWNCPLHLRLFLAAKGRYAFWTDTPNPDRFRSLVKRGVRKAVRTVCFANARAVLGTGAPALRLLEGMGARSATLVNFPYWVELPPPPECNPSGPVTILSVGRLEKVKSYDHLVLLACQLKTQGVKRFQILLVGDGSERADLQRQVEQRGVSDLITMLGWLDNAEVLRRIAACHIFLHTASWEPYGVVILEAMARGRAVLASDRSMAAVDRIQHGENGLLYRHGDIEELAALVTDLLASPAEIARLGGNAYTTACQWPVSRALDLVQEIIGAGREGAL